jgi:hypothetical protein
MRRSIRTYSLAMIVMASLGCSSASPSPEVTDASTNDASGDAPIDAPVVDAETAEIADSNADAGAPCTVGGAPGVCITVAACTALGSSTSTPGYCAGPADIQCCTDTPSVADNPPTPTGYTLMAQSAVTADMTTWAVMILNDPVTYPMFSTTTKTFGTQLVLARVEWHPPDFNNAVVHRGVTLYVPI